MNREQVHACTGGKRGSYSVWQPTDDKTFGGGGGVTGLGGGDGGGVGSLGGGGAGTGGAGTGGAGGGGGEGSLGGGGGGGRGGGICTTGTGFFGAGLVRTFFGGLGESGGMMI